MLKKVEKWTFNEYPRAPGYKMDVYACQFKGNTLVGFDPKPVYFRGVYNHRQRFQADQAPMKKVYRFVTEKILVW